MIKYRLVNNTKVTYYSVKPFISKFQKYSLENTLDKHLSI